MMMNIEREFSALWNRAQLAGDTAVSAPMIRAWATDLGLRVTDVQKHKVELFRPIPTVVLDVEGRKACFPIVCRHSPEWKTTRTRQTTSRFPGRSLDRRLLRQAADRWIQSVGAATKSPSSSSFPDRG